MQTHSTQTDRELAVIDSLLKDPSFAEEMARALDAAYYEGTGQTPPPFLKPEEEMATVSRPAKEEKIATNLAGFYALECGVSYLVATRKLTPSAVLHALFSGGLSKEDETLFACFANAAWKAGQPFRSLERIRREVFMPFALLSEAELEKDLVQVKAAAKVVLKRL